MSLVSDIRLLSIRPAIERLLLQLPFDAEHGQDPNETPAVMVSHAFLGGLSEEESRVTQVDSPADGVRWIVLAPYFNRSEFHGHPVLIQAHLPHYGGTNHINLDCKRCRQVQRLTNRDAWGMPGRMVPTRVVAAWLRRRDDTLHPAKPLRAEGDLFGVSTDPKHRTVIGGDLLRTFSAEYCMPDGSMTYIFELEAVPIHGSVFCFFKAGQQRNLYVFRHVSPGYWGLTPVPGVDWPYTRPEHGHRHFGTLLEGVELCFETMRDERR